MRAPRFVNAADACSQDDRRPGASARVEKPQKRMHGGQRVCAATCARQQPGVCACERCTRAVARRCDGTRRYRTISRPMKGRTSNRRRPGRGSDCSPHDSAGSRYKSAHPPGRRRLGTAIVAAIAEGSAPADLTVTGLANALPHSWAEQARRCAGLEPSRSDPHCRAAQS